MIEERTPRRKFLARAAAGLGAAVAATLPSSSVFAAKRKRVWKLSPEWGTAEDGCSDKPHQDSRSCHGCNACHSHAKNKLFPNKAKAEKANLRAHPGCKCVPKRGARISKAKWEALFVKKNGKLRGSVDKRYARVRKILGLPPLT